MSRLSKGSSGTTARPSKEDILQAEKDVDKARELVTESQRLLAESEPDLTRARSTVAAANDLHAFFQQEAKRIIDVLTALRGRKPITRTQQIKRNDDIKQNEAALKRCTTEVGRAAASRGCAEGEHGRCAGLQGCSGKMQRNADGPGESARGPQGKKRQSEHQRPKPSFTVAIGP